MIAGFAVLAAMMQHTAQFTVDLAYVVHALPLWFLVFALFLPRLAMVVAWFQGLLGPFHFNLTPPFQGLVPLLFWLLLPRVLVLYLIYQDQGVHFWFLLHLLVALLVWAGGGHRMTRRRRRDN
jgi:hypothetical protein